MAALRIPPYVTWTFIKEGFEIMYSAVKENGYWEVVAKNPELQIKHKWSGRIGSSISFRGVVLYHEKGVNLLPSGFTCWHWDEKYTLSLYIDGRTNVR